MRATYNKSLCEIVVEPNNAEECFGHIIEIGLDYDGCHNKEDLMGLVDELVALAKSGLRFLLDGKITVEDTAEEDAESRRQAKLCRAFNEAF